MSILILEVGVGYGKQSKQTPAGRKGREGEFSPSDIIASTMRQASEALAELLSSQQITEFDRSLFDYQHEALRRGEPVCYSQQEWLALDPRQRRIITSRLRMLGYQFEPLTYTWGKKFRKTLCDHLAGEGYARVS